MQLLNASSRSMPLAFQAQPSGVVISNTLTGLQSFRTPLAEDVLEMDRTRFGERKKKIVTTRRRKSEKTINAERRQERWAKVKENLGIAITTIILSVGGSLGIVFWGVPSATKALENYNQRLAEQAAQTENTHVLSDEEYQLLFMENSGK